MNKNVKSKGLIVKYEPLYKSFSIISGELFHYNNESHQFELDMNPYGDPETVPILDLKYHNNKLFFKIISNSQIVNYSISSKYKPDQLIYQMMVDLNNKFNFDLNENDKFCIEFEKSTLKRIELIRFKNVNIEKSLIIIFENKDTFVIKYPFEKLPLQSIDIKKDSIICKTNQEIIEWKTTNQDLIFSYFCNIIKVGIVL